jgi:Universal stress protein family
MSPMRRARTGDGGSGRRILFPFNGSTVSNAALELILALAWAQDATLIPAYLAVVPHHLSLDSPVPERESELAMPLLELIEQRATVEGVPVDSRIERGRTARHALGALLETERFDTLVVTAKAGTGPGFEPADVSWLLQEAPGELLVLRPG